MEGIGGTNTNSNSYRLLLRSNNNAYLFAFKSSMKNELRYRRRGGHHHHHHQQLSCRHHEHPHPHPHPPEAINNIPSELLFTAGTATGTETSAGTLSLVGPLPKSKPKSKPKPRLTLKVIERILLGGGVVCLLGMFYFPLQCPSPSPSPSPSVGCHYEIQTSSNLSCRLICPPTDSSGVYLTPLSAWSCLAMFFALGIACADEQRYMNYKNGPALLSTASEVLFTLGFLASAFRTMSTARALDYSLPRLPTLSTITPFCNRGFSLSCISLSICSVGSLAILNYRRHKESERSHRKSIRGGPNGGTKDPGSCRFHVL